MGNKDEIKVGKENKKGNSGITSPVINSVFFLHLIQGLSSLPDTPSPPHLPFFPLTRMPPGCHYSHHPQSWRKVHLWIFIVLAHTRPACHESFISSVSFSPSLPLSCRVCIHGWMRLPRWGIMMRKMRDIQQRFAMLGCPQLCSGVNDNSLHEGRLELPSYQCHITQSRDCSYADLRTFLLHCYKDLFFFFWKMPLVDSAR